MPNDIERRVRWAQCRQKGKVFKPFSLIEARHCLENNQQMQYDHVTGVLTRGIYEEWKEIVLADRRSYPLTVIMVDVNGLKAINDGFGHSVGDYVLKEVGSALIDSIREQDLLARYGGDEYVLLMRRLDKQGAKRIRKRIREEVEKRNSKGYGFKISVAVGSETFGGTESNYGVAFKKADRKMYKDKIRIKKIL